MTGLPPNLALFDKTYDETVALLEEARSFVASGHWDNLPRTDLLNLYSAREALRLTTRLSQVLAWLLVRRAVAAGELTVLEAATDERWHLGSARICRDRSGLEIDGLPNSLRDMLERSYQLYVRVARLDELVRRQAGAEST